MRIYGVILLCSGMGVQLVGNLLKIVLWLDFERFFSTDIGLYGVGGKNFDLGGMVYIFGVLVDLYSGQMYSVHTPRLILLGFRTRGT